MLKSFETRILRIASDPQSRIVLLVLTILLGVGSLLAVVLSFTGDAAAAVKSVDWVVGLTGLVVAIPILSTLYFRRNGARINNNLKAALGEEFCDEVIGDLEEVFLREREVVGDFRARMQFRRALLAVMVRRCWRLVLQVGLRERG
jgi:hypothetical protein